jgi:tetratricopeptide (TPR) repeat protein
MIAELGPDECALAQAMIWNRLAEYHDDQAEYYDGTSGSPEGLDDELPHFASPIERDRERKLVMECLEKSIALAPAYLPTYRLLVDLVDEWRDPEKTEAAAQRLLAVFPDDLDTLVLMANHHRKLAHWDRAIEFVVRARAEKPLDPALLDLETSIRVELARELALARRFDDGRAQFDKAAQLSPEVSREYHFLVKRAALEFKAGAAAAADSFLGEAIALLGEPTAVWLAMAIEARRYHLTKATADCYVANLTVGLKKKCTSETAGELAVIFRDLIRGGIEYPGRAQHLKMVLAYLKRSTKLKYRPCDIENVCELVHIVDGQTKLLQTLVPQGLKVAPKSVLLNFQAALLAMENRKSISRFGTARRHVTIAIEQAEASTLEHETQKLPLLRALLTGINEFEARQSPLARLIPGFADFYANSPFDEDEWDDEDDDRDPADPWPDPKPQIPLRKKAKGKKK